MADLDKTVVDFSAKLRRDRERAGSPSGDDVPNLLVNGAEGIAVGMSHQHSCLTTLGEVVDAVQAYIDDQRQLRARRPDAIICRDLDFPTGGHGCK